MIDTGRGSTEKYAWLCADQQCNTIDCYKSSWDSQTVCKLLGATELTSFHDAELADATKKINSIISRIEKANKDKKKSFPSLSSRTGCCSFGRLIEWWDHMMTTKRLQRR
jgi:hypothetical protein